jgi:hypothetical protein
MDSQSNFDLGIVTCKQFAELTADDKKFLLMLQAKQVNVSVVPWDDLCIKRRQQNCNYI